MFIEKSCVRYWLCVGGYPRLQRCAAGLAVNPNTLKCELASTVPGCEPPPTTTPAAGSEEEPAQGSGNGQNSSGPQQGDGNSGGNGGDLPQGSSNGNGGGLQPQVQGSFPRPIQFQGGQTFRGQPQNGGNSRGLVG